MPYSLKKKKKTVQKIIPLGIQELVTEAVAIKGQLRILLIPNSSTLSVHTTSLRYYYAPF